MIGAYRGIYHSTLVKCGEVHVTIKSGVMKSKKAGQPDFIVMEHDSGGDQFYNVENQRCADALRNKKGESITIRATGSKADADIQILNVDGTAKSPATTNSASSASLKDGTSEFKHSLMKILNAFWIIEKAVGIEVAQSAISGFESTPEHIQAKCSTAFICLDRQGFVKDLPDHPMWSTPAPAEEPGEPDWGTE